MGSISATAAGLSLSFRAGCMRSASVASALGADISETNMNKGAACLKVKKESVKMSASIEENLSVLSWLFPIVMDKRKQGEQYTIHLWCGCYWI